LRSDRYLAEQQEQLEHPEQHEPVDHDAEVRTGGEPAVRGAVHVTRTQQLHPLLGKFPLALTFSHRKQATRRRKKSASLSGGSG